VPLSPLLVPRPLSWCGDLLLDGLTRAPRIEVGDIAPPGTPQGGPSHNEEVAEAFIFGTWYAAQRISTPLFAARRENAGPNELSVSRMR
jgi:hypothetical protein